MIRSALGAITISGLSLLAGASVKLALASAHFGSVFARIASAAVSVRIEQIRIVCCQATAGSNQVESVDCIQCG